MITSELLNRAKKYAITAHGDQKYGDEFPYAIHLQAVESVLIRFGITTERHRIAAWLHDVLEDTDRTYEEVGMFFGVEVAEIVAALTEPKGGNRKWRHDQTYPRIRENVDAIIIKLADRIANVESGGKKVVMYRKEHIDFKNALSGPTVPMDAETAKVIRHMWEYLDDLLVTIG
jgi:(p)ppGpp synthase/HD superfamily hydrolase